MVDSGRTHLLGIREPLETPFVPRGNSPAPEVDPLPGDGAAGRTPTPSLAKGGESARPDGMAGIRD
jgi:hypothetical protein